VSIHYPETVARLEEMRKSPYYSLARGTIIDAVHAIHALERRIEELKKENTELRQIATDAALQELADKAGEAFFNDRD
jgi:hypothetical protein